jgi:aminotransferase
MCATVMKSESHGYQDCTRCVMDTSDPEIEFDSEGVCSHCRHFESATREGWFPNEEGARMLKERANAVKAAGRGNEYDCILGLSGGVDSSSLALRVAELGLRPLVVHVDGGWNREVAVSNIERVVNHCGFELHTIVMDWEEMRDLQVAFLRAGVANQDVPQDHAFFANLYHFAVKNKIKTVLSGGNIATEGIYPHSWQGSAMDSINLRAIHRKHGDHKLKRYKTIGFWAHYLWFPFALRMSVWRPLNFLPFHKGEAIKELTSSCGWRPYGRKHGESVFTKFFQNYYLPTKFGYDKRRPHYSSMIVSGQMERADAVERLTDPLYDPEELRIDREYFCTKLGISEAELDRHIAAPARHYSDYPNWDRHYAIMKRAQGAAETLTGRRIRGYS